MLAGGSSSNIATPPRVADLEGSARYTSQLPRAPSGRASGKVIKIQPSPSSPTISNEQMAIIAVSAPNCTAPSPVDGRKTQDASPPSITGNNRKIVKPYRPL